MKEKKMELMPVASRSRKQRELREKELREKNKRAWLAARNEHWKKNAAKMRNPSLGGDDNEENVIVVDESTYLKRTSMMGEKESSRNVDVSFEESSDDSVQIVGERWNPLGTGFDNNEDGDEVDGAATGFKPGPSKASSKGCSEHGVDNQSLSMDVASEDSGAASDSHCSPTLESSETDDKVSDEDFLVEEAEMHTACSSESSQYHSAYASEKEGKWKRKTSAKKINDRFLEEDIQSDTWIYEKIQSSDEFDEDYLQSLKCNYGTRSNQGEKAEIFSSSVNGGKRKRGRPPKNRSPGIVYEAEDSAMSDNYDCSKNGSFIQSSPLPYHSSSKNGATKTRGRPRKNTCEIIRSESESENDPIGVFAKSENGGYRKRGRLPHFEGITDGDEQYLKWLRSRELSGRCRNAGNRKRGRPPKGINVGVNSESENELKPMNGGYRKRGRPPQKTIVEITESESENDLVGEFENFENGANRERGKVGAHFETENELKPMNGYRKRGRPPKKTIVETKSASESENNIFGEFGKFENRGNRERGTLSQFDDIEDGDELYMQWLRNLELSGRCENGGNSKRGRPPKRMNIGVASEPENYGHQQRGRLPKNGGYGKRGRPPKNWNKGFDSERGYKKTRGRPPKNWNKGFDSDRCCKRGRGRPRNMSRI